MSSLEEKTLKAMQNKEKLIKEEQKDKTPKDKKTQSNSTPRISRPPKPKKIIVPEYIINLFNNLDKSITSAWGIQQNKKVKWDSKYNQWESFKMWFEELSNK